MICSVRGLLLLASYTVERIAAQQHKYAQELTCPVKGQ